MWKVKELYWDKPFVKLSVNGINWWQNGDNISSVLHFCFIYKFMSQFWIKSPRLFLTIMYDYRILILIFIYHFIKCNYSKRNVGIFDNNQQTNQATDCLLLLVILDKKQYLLFQYPSIKQKHFMKSQHKDTNF